jgi:DNA polymerase (family 10)
MDNYQIADHFSLLAKLMDINGENSFKTKTYAVAAFQIEKLLHQLAEMEPSDIVAQKGIGAAVSQKIGELLQSGKLSLLEKYIAQTPAGIIEMLNIKGLGPKKINTIWKEMGIESIGELQYACNENRLTLYKGFGEKTQQNVSEAISFYMNQQGRFLYQQVEDFSNQLISIWKTEYPNDKIELTGSFRRQEEIIDILHLLTTTGQKKVEEFLSNHFSNATITADGKVILVQLDGAPKIEINIANQVEWGSASIQHSGNDLFNEAIQPLLPAQTAMLSEEEIFIAAGLAFIPPALRDRAEIIELAQRNQIPKLIAPADIQGIIHTHSTWSDGSHSIEQMATAAKDAGLEYLVISDHSKSAAYANGLSEERIRQQHAEIDRLNASLAPFKIFKSIECDILGDGQLDYPNEVLATFDLVIASVHSNLKMSEEKAMQRLLTAIANPYVTILGHMTGRLLLSRNGYPLDHNAIIDACIANHVVIELNAHPRRLDIDWRWIGTVTEKGGLISINPDAHAVEGYADTRYGVMVAQKAMLTKEKNLSSFSLQAFESFLEATKKAKGLTS